MQGFLWEVLQCMCSKITRKFVANYGSDSISFSLAGNFTAERDPCI